MSACCARRFTHGVLDTKISMTPNSVGANPCSISSAAGAPLRRAQRRNRLLSGRRRMSNRHSPQGVPRLSALLECRDLDKNFTAFQIYFNEARIHSSLNGQEPAEFPELLLRPAASAGKFRWRSFCRCIYDLSVAAWAHIRHGQMTGLGHISDCHVLIRTGLSLRSCGLETRHGAADCLFS